MGTRSQGLDEWLDRLSEAELPALAVVVQDLHRLAQAENSSVKQLADVLLRDASLTSKVLRIANSAYYNPSQEGISTISRAIVLIGFDNVRLIGLSVNLVDGLLTRTPREQLQALLARSFHAAVQARTIAGYVLTKHREEVFIAALLHHLGELTFWGCGGSQVDELARALAKPGVDVDEAINEVLGTDFRQLTQGLLKSWNLSDSVSQAQNGAIQHNPAAQAVSLGVRISEAALQGWDAPQMQALIEQMATFTGVSREEALQQVLSSADEAVKVAVTFGASSLGRLIPATDPKQIRLKQEQRQARLLQADMGVLKESLQALGAMVSKRGELGLILDTLLNGLHQGAGLERVMLVVLSDGQTRFRAKRVMGEGAQHWLSDFELPADSQAPAHIFSYVLRHQEALWMGVPASSSLNELVTQPLRKSLGPGMFFIAPLLAGKRQIGVLYADNRPSGRALKHEQFVAFQRFTQLTGRCLQALSQKPAR